MNTLPLLPIFLLCSLAGAAQVSSKLEIGFSGTTGTNYYNRKYYNQPELPPGRTTDLKSNYLAGAGSWGERHLNHRISLLGEVQYASVDVPTNFLCECSNTGWVILQDEKHYWGSLDLGLRYYFNPQSAVLIFAEGKAQGEWLIAAKERRNDHVYVHWDAMGYSHFAPSLSFAVGVKWKRLAVSFGGKANLARTQIRQAGVHDEVYYGMKTGLLSRGIFVKSAFTLFKFK